MIGHFHSHTHYSILDGAMTVDQLVSKAKERGIDAVAVTEHGNIYSAAEFFFKAKEMGIKPIIGCELYIHPKKMTDKLDTEDKVFHATVLVKDEAGYKNLCILLKLANTIGFKRKPLIDLQTLIEYREGLILLSGCLNGVIPRFIQEGEVDKANDIAGQFKKIFKNDFYLEIIRNEPADPSREDDIATINRQRKVNNHLLEISEKLGIPIVATGDCHYTDPESFEIQDMLVCIRYNEKLNTERKYRYKVKGLYINSKDEFEKKFSDIKEALQSHEEMIKKCNFEFKKSSELRIPKPPEFGDPDETLKKKAYDGLRKRIQEKREKGEKFNENEYWEKLENELAVISKKNFSSYFLIVDDFIRYAKENGIMVGPGRGSAAGSITSWALGITDLDPIKYGLIFERFLNPEREKPPDIDVDFCKENRDRVIEYIMNKYGQDNVAHIITFGTFGARAAIRDVGRILDEPLQDVSYLAELIPQEPSRKWTLQEAYDEIPEVKNTIDNNPRFKKIFEKAKKIEGLIRHVGSHASGFLISDNPITEYTSISNSKGEITTQFEMESLGKIGLVKFDFLGLETLTVIDKTFKLIKQRYGKDLSFKNIPFDDKKTYDMLKAGDVFGVFQFESAGMRELLMRLEPSCLEDLIAAVALYRPGPIQSGIVNDYIERKKGIKPVEYPHPALEPILKETYGTFLYQEQIMFAANILAGFSMGEADILREAMGKKKAELMSAMRERFISGCEKNGITEEKAEEIFSIMEKFAGYAFNKSHSAAYAFLSYVTAYLKANYPVEYMAALLSSEIKDHEKLTKYVENVMKLGFKILPPSITKSEFEFGVEGDKIRFGLGGIKGLGKAAAEAIIKMREKVKMSNFEQFIIFAKKYGINKKVIETLVKAGAFDEFIDRGEAIRKLEFQLRGEISPTIFSINNKNKITPEEIEKMEIEVLGVVLSSERIEERVRKKTNEFLPIKINGIFEFLGFVKKITPSKSGAILSVKSAEGNTYEVLMIERKSAETIKEGEIYIFLGKIAGKAVVAKEFFKPEESFLIIKMPYPDEEKLKKLKEILSLQPDGDTEVIIELSNRKFSYARKILASQKLKTELWENGFLFLLAPTKYRSAHLI